MKIRKLLSIAIVLVMVFAIVPVISLAEGVDALANEVEAMNKLDRTWAAINAAEEKALEAKLNRTEVINAVYTAALNNSLVDRDGFSDFTKDGFFFTVNGMYCSYNYRLRNELGAVTEPANDSIIRIEGNGSDQKNATNPDVLLLGPYYGYDSSFDNSYRNVAEPLAGQTGGDFTLIQGHAATGPVIAEQFGNFGTILVDSHGTANGSSTYICLTTKDGITQEDFSNGWAVNAGSAAYIDGRYILNHCNVEANTVANPFVWLGICEGMKLSGHGTTGYALLEAGCGAVYGYSQSVTFVADLTMYLPTFWAEMGQGATVADAFQVMKDRYGVPDPRGDAYPIVMSPVDDFPANPDSEQTVYCEWTLFGEAEPVALESFTLDTNAVEMYVGRSATVTFGRVPDNANQYELVWTSANENVATVTGNNRRANITGVNPGTTTVTCTVMVDGQVFGTATVAVTVNIDTSLYDSLNVEGGTIAFGTSEQYPFIAEEADGRFYAKSGNGGVGNSTSSVTATINMHAGETLTFDYKYSSENNYDWFNFTVDGQQKIHVSGTNNANWQTYTYTATADGAVTFVWSYSKDGSMNNGDDCVKLDEVAYSGQSGIPGDVDGSGSITIADAILVHRHVLGLNLLNEDQLAIADINGDGDVNTVDATLIARAAMGL